MEIQKLIGGATVQTEKEIHCKHCESHKLLAKIHKDGKIYVWCKECRKEVELEVEPYEPERNPVQSEKN